MPKNHSGSGSLATGAVGPLLLRLAVPLMASMTAQAFYNTVDTAFMGWLGEDALAAVTCAFPAQALMIACATGTGAGVMALLSRILGARENAEAGRVAGNALALALLMGLAFGAFGAFGAGAFMSMQGGDGEVLALGGSYLSITCGISIFYFLSVALENMLSASGRTSLVMVMQLAGAVANIAGDWLLVFGNLGAPALGVQGAAIASVAGQALSMALGIAFNFAFNTDVRVGLTCLRLHVGIVSRIYAVGLPSMLIQMSGSAFVLASNQVMAGLGTSAIASNGICLRLHNLVFMAIYGLGNSVVIVASNSLGAGKAQRAVRTVSVGVAFAVGLALCGTVAYAVEPSFFTAALGADERLRQVADSALRITALGFPFAAVCVASSSAFQAFDRAALGAGVALFRQFLCALPVAVLLAACFGAQGVWWAFPLADALGSCVSFILLARVVRRS